MNNKNKKIAVYAVGLIVVVLIVLGLVNAAQNNGGGSPASSTGVLAAIENNFDFSTISMKNGNVSHDFKIKNEGDESVIIEKIYTSCMCTTATIIDNLGKKRGTFGMAGHGFSSKARIKVGAGESIDVEVLFDPAAHGLSGVGLIERAIYLETNSTKSPSLELTIRALVTN